MAKLEVLFNKKKILMDVTSSQTHHCINNSFCICNKWNVAVDEKHMWFSFWLSTYVRRPGFGLYGKANRSLFGLFVKRPYKLITFIRFSCILRSSVKRWRKVIIVLHDKIDTIKKKEIIVILVNQKVSVSDVAVAAAIDALTPIITSALAPHSITTGSMSHLNKSCTIDSFHDSRLLPQLHSVWLVMFSSLNMISLQIVLFKGNRYFCRRY